MTNIWVCEIYFKLCAVHLCNMDFEKDTKEVSANTSTVIIMPLCLFHFFIKWFWNFVFVADTTSVLVILNELTSLEKVMVIPNAAFSSSSWFNFPSWSSHWTFAKIPSQVVLQLKPKFDFSSMQSLPFRLHLFKPWKQWFQPSKKCLTKWIISLN